MSLLLVLIVVNEPIEIVADRFRNATPGLADFIDERVCVHGDSSGSSSSGVMSFGTKSPSEALTFWIWPILFALAK